MKRCGNQFAILNLPAGERFETDNIMLVALYKASVYKAHGMARVIAGVDEEGVQHDEHNLAKDLRALDEGKPPNLTLTLTLQ